jgi:hypothetical protein
MKKLKTNAPKAFKKLFISQSVIDSASNNSRKSISDFELTDVIQHVDEHTQGDDAEFQLEFTKAVFSMFGWKYFTKKELDKMDRKASDKLYDEIHLANSRADLEDGDWQSD